ncbi:hypothetical protein AgCh_040259 [Apium graveolens]
MPVQEKTDITNYQPVLTPPEGNTTFLDGTSWCVARPGASQGDLQDALDWACGMGKTDCSPIKSGGPCFEPNTLLSHASFAFNSYYQQNGNSDIACNFGGTATLTKRNPSKESSLFLSEFKCVFWILSIIKTTIYLIMSSINKSGSVVDLH